MEKINKQICVIGAGRWGINHIRTLDKLGVLGGVVEVDESKYAYLKDQWPNLSIFSRLKDAILEKFDGFTIATPAQFHFEMAKFLLENKKPVLVEKPITLESGQARQLNEIAKANKVNLMVGHVLLFHPAIQKIKELIQSGKIGDLQYLYSNRLNLGTVRTEENVFWSFAPHDISIFQYLTTSYPSKIVCSGGAFLQDKIHDTTLTMFEYPENVKGHIFVSWLHPFKEHRLIVIGSKGMLRFEDSLVGKPLVYYNKGFEWNVGEPVKREGPTEKIDYDNKMPLTEELKYFVDHLDGKPIELADGKNGIEVVEILEKATQSLLNGTVYE